MALKITLAEFMGVSDEWLAGYYAAKDEERTCEGCKYDGTNKFSAPCFDCTHENYNDLYEPKEAE